MKVTVSLEHRFWQTPDGAVWTEVAFAESFWRRYLDVFDTVRVLARVSDVPSAQDGWARVDGDRVTFAGVPMYLGPWQYLARAAEVRRAVREGVDLAGAVIMRVPSQLAVGVEKVLRRVGHPYGVEAVGDPYDTFSPGAVRHVLRPFFRWWFCRALRRHCAGASWASYVTRGALQTRYPPGRNAFTTNYSSIELPRTAFASKPRFYDPATFRVEMITVGTLAQLYKAPDVLIDAVGKCVGEGLNLRLTLVGDGRHRAELELRAKERGLGSRVRFVGQLPGGEAVWAALDRADLFVLPSRQEGLPRAMIEAMARGLPCIGSNVGGIPELLPAEDLVPPGDVAALAARIREVVTDPGRLARMSARNLLAAHEYSDEVLRERRLAFYRHVRDATEEWLKSNRRGRQGPL